ncbi:MAG: thermonuclease family protein [Rickettsiales bacterium]|jgi:endonuclease YncB( thermonuclease family)|nr:thermonuclease family protein [Rickettsiales bacterium]
MRFPAILLCLFCPAANAGGDLRATAGYVLDGDTFSAKIHLENGAVFARVRIANIDAPELSGECGEEKELANQARHRLSALLPEGTAVYLSKIKDDKYLGRIDALVSLDGKDIGEIMIAEKLARRYNGGRRAPWCPQNEEEKK